MDDFERPEAPKLDDEDVSQSDDVTSTEEALSQLDAEAPAVASQGPVPELLLAQKNSKKKVSLIVLAVVLVLALVGGAIWFALANKAPQGGTNEDMASQPSESGNNDDEKPADKPEPKDEIVELSVDDELVQRLYEPFTSYPGINGFGFRTFYDRATETGGNPETALIGQILWAVGEEVECASEMAAIGYCVDAEAIHQRFQEAFGYDFVDRNIDDYGPCGGVWYVEETNQYFLGTGCGGSAPAQLNHWLYKADQQGKYLYLYELVEIWKAEFAEESGEFIRNKHCHFDKVCSETPTEGEDLLNISSEVVLVSDNDSGYSHDPSLTAVNFREYAEELDMVRWTFVWNGENYVFEKLDKVR